MSSAASPVSHRASAEPSAWLNSSHPVSQDGWCWAWPCVLQSNPRFWAPLCWKPEKSPGNCWHTILHQGWNKDEVNVSASILGEKQIVSRHCGFSCTFFRALWCIKKFLRFFFSFKLDFTAKIHILYANTGGLIRWGGNERRNWERGFCHLGKKSWRSFFGSFNLSTHLLPMWWRCQCSDLAFWSTTHALWAGSVFSGAPTS